MRYLKDLLLDSPIYVGGIILALLWQHGHWVFIGGVILGITIAARDAIRERAA